MKLFLKSFFILLVLASCSSNDEIIPNEVSKESNETILGRGLSPGGSDSGYILSALVESGQYISWNFSSTNSGYCNSLYTVYATSGTTTVDYDRAVHIGVVASGNNVVDTKVVIIPAGETHSNNVQVASYTSQDWGDVQVRIFSVTDRSYTVNYTSEFELRSTSAHVNNCYILDNTTGGDPTDPDGTIDIDDLGIGGN